jgi:hypothetical protein
MRNAWTFKVRIQGSPSFGGFVDEVAVSELDYRLSEVVER